MYVYFVSVHICQKKGQNEAETLLKIKFHSDRFTSVAFVNYCNIQLKLEFSVYSVYIVQVIHKITILRAPNLSWSLRRDKNAMYTYCLKKQKSVSMFICIKVCLFRFQNSKQLYKAKIRFSLNFINAKSSNSVTY